MSIKGLSERRRLSRQGKIRLGVLVEEPGKKPYPKATDYFVCPPEVEAACGPGPIRSLPIMFPVDDPAVLFPQELRMYKTAGLWCSGNAETAHRWDHQGALKELKCPCPFLESGECGREATLNFMLPDVPGAGGIWQITTGNKRSIISINTDLEKYLRMFGGLAGIPFTLLLEKQQTQRFDEAKQGQVKTTIYMLRLSNDLTLREVLEWRQKIGAPTMPALLPASLAEEQDRLKEEEEAVEVKAEPEESARRAEPPAETPSAESPKKAQQTPPPGELPLGPADPEPTLEWCIKEAEARLGITPIAYQKYLCHAYKVGDLANLPPAAFKEQRALLAQARDKANAEVLKRAVIAGANAASQPKT